MRLRILGSNSAGNSYILENDHEALIVEAGIDVRDVKKALNYDLAKVSGAVVSHRHGDHARFVSALLFSGVQTLALSDVFTSHGVDGHPCAHAVVPKKQYKVGNFFVTPFSVSHDVPCVGWLIRHAEMGKLLFVTDTVTLDYVFEGLTQIMIEANYSDDIIERRLEKDEINLQMYKRILGSHMSLDTAMDVLRRHDLSKVDNIILIHLSNGSSDEAHFVDAVTAMTGKCVYAADRGMTINLTNPY